jgi:hypothetical protein
MTSYRASSAKKKTATRKKLSRASRKSKTTWADPTVSVKKISKAKRTKKQVPQLSCWWFG